MYAALRLCMPSGNPIAEAAIALTAPMGAQVWVVAHNGSYSDALQLAEHCQILKGQILFEPPRKSISEIILGQTNGLGVDIHINASSKSTLCILGEDIIAPFGRVFDLSSTHGNELEVEQLPARCATYARVETAG
ncbi:uncharacterized protein ACLA_053260 [Aspergillus clavatus NRRL 1]|uniref:Uncharacterized protein n=1 Tax=Aspergillus clavatus (strain ATCC 1007 / CBS 513.65 / DSM 816 / NCTC 3887 / NRRL 1 / QM 1276 / 107) TaxID=344612 RepID=A1CIZ7_ASPCL|nr:uncharacterized protein ACLA_053260 [Aspergillus clavatus NRRL 1]EAW10852.1 hypothetical protein ACLA_053260 [Aspergillus clavatus NRRL 1]